MLRTNSRAGMVKRCTVGRGKKPLAHKKPLEVQKTCAQELEKKKGEGYIAELLNKKET